MGGNTVAKRKKKVQKSQEQTRTTAKRTKDVEKSESSAGSSDEDEGQTTKGTKSSVSKRKKLRSVVEDSKMNKRSVVKKKKNQKIAVNVPRGPTSPEPNGSSSDSSRRRKAGTANSITGTNTGSGPQTMTNNKKRHVKADRGDRGDRGAMQPSCGLEEELAWNEVADAEAERPGDIAPDIVVREGFVLGIKGKRYRFLETIDQDFGVTPVVNVPPEGSSEKIVRYTMNYEISTAKLKRLKVQATILALAAASPKLETHFHRISVLGHAGTLKFLMTEEHGPTLADLLTGQGNCFSPPTAFKIGIQTFEAIEQLHLMGYICRDIKPQAFAVGKPGKHSNTVYLIHIGLGRRIGSDSTTRTRVPFFGSRRYCSRRTHLEEERGRSDDIESWLYMFVEFFNERALSWRSLHNKNAIHKDKENFFTIPGFEDVKKKTKVLPDSFFGRIVDPISVLKIEETPDYNVVLTILRDAIHTGGYSKYPYDWDTASNSNNTTMAGAVHGTTLPGVVPSVIPFSRLPTARQL